MAGRLHYKNVSAAHVFLNLDVRLAVGKPGDQCLSARETKKCANGVSQRFIGSAAEDFELVINTRAVRLALVLLLSGHSGLLFRRGRESSHCSRWSFVAGRSRKPMPPASLA